MSQYLFVSCASLITGKNIGCFVVKSSLKKNETVSITPEIGEKLKEFNIDLKTSDLELWQFTQSEFEAEKMELNKFYSREEMLNRGNKTAILPISLIKE